jgi:hypothetical protein
MIKLSAVIVSLFFITTVFVSCSSNPKETNDELQDNKEATATVLRDSLMDNEASISKALLLVPGQAAGNINIDQNSEEIFKLLGKPDSSDAAMQKMVAFWYKEDKGTKYSTSIFTARDTIDQSTSLVRQIRVTSPAFKTKDRLGVNSTLANIRIAYDVEEIKYPLTPKKEMHIWIDKEGIAFEIGNDERCRAVIIYKKGNDPSSTYLPLR